MNTKEEKAILDKLLADEQVKLKSNKRLSDVAPVLVGGLLIGGASAIAGWFAASWVPTGGIACTN